jgi:gas vesicle protein
VKVFVKGDGMRKRKVRNTVRLLSGFIVSGLIGAVVALLMAPQSGNQLRALIRDKSSDISGRMMSSLEETRSRAEDMAQLAMDRAEGLIRRGEAEIQSH